MPQCKIATMQVSVVIPVYNAQAYVRQAVESALAQPETGEVLLIEDASPDNSLVVCQALAAEHEKVILYRHPGGTNRGAGASRNLGIQHARYDYIAFLDADDFFLPDRFTVARKIFAANPTVDGVYEAVGIHFETEEAEAYWYKRSNRVLVTMSQRVPPEDFFAAQGPIGDLGYVLTDGWVVKRTIFERTGLFDESLPLHQDTVMYVKFAAMGRMVPGRLTEPVAKYRLHENNRNPTRRSAENIYTNHALMWSTLWRWGNQHLGQKRRAIIAQRFIDYVGRPHKGVHRKPKSRLGYLLFLLRLLQAYPKLATELYYWKRYQKYLLPAKAKLQQRHVVLTQDKLSDS